MRLDNYLPYDSDEGLKQDNCDGGVVPDELDSDYLDEWV